MSPRIPGTRIHAVALTPVLFMLVRFSAVTVCFALATLIFMGVLSWKGRTLTWVIRKVKCNLRAREVSARPFWYRRRFCRLESIDLVGIRDDFDVAVGRGAGKAGKV